MSEQIDWSKAPEWATRLMRNKYGCPTAWADDHKDAIWVTDYESGSDMIFNLDPTAWDLIENRPTTPSWSGEGLPPVGAVCMAGCEQVVIVAHHCNGIHAIYAESEVDGLLYYGEPNEFRPIRTPEQIAADARSKAIGEMVKALGMDDPGTAEYIRCGLIYDAGYRKP